jgi:hypothetical protein
MANTVAVVLVLLFTTGAWLLFLKPKTGIPSGTKPLPGPKGKASLHFELKSTTTK